MGDRARTRRGDQVILAKGLHKLSVDAPVQGRTSQLPEGRRRMEGGRGWQEDLAMSSSVKWVY